MYWEGPPNGFFRMEEPLLFYEHKEVSQWKSENARERRLKWVFRPLNSWWSLEPKTGVGFTLQKDGKTKNMKWIIYNKEVKMMTVEGSCFYNKVRGKGLWLSFWEGGVTWGLWSSGFGTTSGDYGLNCFPLPVPTFICWGPNPQDLKLWFYLEIRCN